MVQKSDVSGNSSYNGGRDVHCEEESASESLNTLVIQELYIFKMIVIKISSWNEIGRGEIQFFKV